MTELARKLEETDTVFERKEKWIKYKNVIYYSFTLMYVYIYMRYKTQ